MSPRRFFLTFAYTAYVKLFSAEVKPIAQARLMRSPNLYHIATSGKNQGVPA